MARKVIHAPDGAMIPGSLCQEPTGDVSTFECDVDCADCLDLLEGVGENLRPARSSAQGTAGLSSCGRTHRRPVKVQVGRLERG